MEKQEFVQFILDHHKEMTCSEMAKKLGATLGRVHHYLKFYGLVNETKKFKGGGGNVEYKMRRPKREGYFDVDVIGKDRTWIV